MSECKHYSKLRGDMVNYVCPANIHIMMSGVKWAKQDKTGTITLCYTDDTTQSKKTTKDIVTEFDSFFDIVSFVQN